MLSYAAFAPEKIFPNEKKKKKNKKILSFS